MTIKNTNGNEMPEEIRRATEVTLSPEMYHTCRQRGLSFTELLESLDPSESGSALDAFERQLAAAGIRVSGDRSDVIDRFFASSESAVLFPEFVARSVRIGMEDFRKLERVTATRTRIDSDTYRTVYMDDSALSASDLQLAKVGEGAALPKIEIKTAEHSLTIYKFGRYLEATYEALRRRRASLVSLFLRAVGVQIQKDKFTMAVGVLIDGDGNSNAAAVQNTATDDTLVYADLVEFALAFEPYTLNVMIANKTTAKKLLTLTEFKDPAARFDFQHTGDMVTPFGAQLIVDEAVSTDLIVGLDRRFALEEVYETGIVTESDRLIRQQIEGTAISEVAGFGKIINSATRVLDINWS